MKKLVLSSVCAFAMAGAAFAQGTVNWSTISSSNMSGQTNSTAYSPLFGGGSTGTGAVGNISTAPAGFYYELLYTSQLVSGQQVQDPYPTTLASLFTWKDAGLGGTNSIAIGRVVVPLGNQNNAGASLPSSWNNGTTNDIMLVGWSANLGTTWGAVSNVLNHWATLGSTVVGQAFFGESATGFINPLTTGTSPGAAVFGSPNAQGTPIFSPNTQLYLLPVPEPATMALMGLGGLSLLLFRRSRKS
jgi:hypothetical protein